MYPFTTPKRCGCGAVYVALPLTAVYSPAWQLWLWQCSCKSTLCAKEPVVS